MTLLLLQQDDGVLTVVYKSSDGRTSDVADFYVKPMMDGLGMSRSAAIEWQRQFAGMLVAAYGKHFKEPPHKSSDISALITGDKDCTSAVGRPHPDNGN